MLYRYAFTLWSNWGRYLPIKYKIEILKERYFDFGEAIELINNIQLIEI